MNKKLTDQNLAWILSWYSHHCNGDWERGNGVEIRTLDNPGWYIKINLDETELQGKPFSEMTIDLTDNDWMQCFISENKFIGVGGTLNLPKVFQIFRNWAEAKIEKSQTKIFSVQIEKIAKEDNFFWLLQWYHRQCDGDWEHGHGIHMGNFGKPGWYLKINLDETELQDQNFEALNINRSYEDWIYCAIEDNIFSGYCGPLNLLEIIQIFRNWAIQLQ